MKPRDSHPYFCDCIDCLNGKRRASVWRRNPLRLRTLFWWWAQ